MNVQLAISSKREYDFCSGAVAYSDAYFGSGSGPYHLDNVQCRGSEVSIFSCSHSGTGVHNCRPGNEARVKCVFGKFYIPWKQLMVDTRKPSILLSSGNWCSLSPWDIHSELFYQSVDASLRNRHRNGNYGARGAIMNQIETWRSKHNSHNCQPLLPEFHHYGWTLQSKNLLSSWLPYYICNLNPL